MVVPSGQEGGEGRRGEGRAERDSKGASKPAGRTKDRSEV